MNRFFIDIYFNLFISLFDFNLGKSTAGQVLGVPMPNPL